MALDVRGLTPLLSVYDMPTSVRFYRDLLGFDVAMHSPTIDEVMFHSCLLRLGDAELMLNTEYEFNSERPAQRPPAFTDAHSKVSTSAALTSTRRTHNSRTKSRP